LSELLRAFPRIALHVAKEMRWFAAVVTVALLYTWAAYELGKPRRPLPGHIADVMAIAACLAIGVWLIVRIVVGDLHAKYVTRTCEAALLCAFGFSVGLVTVTTMGTGKRKSRQFSDGFGFDGFLLAHCFVLTPLCHRDHVSPT